MYVRIIIEITNSIQLHECDDHVDYGGWYHNRQVVSR